MAISFPITLPNLPDLLPIVKAPWNEFRQEEMSSLGTGEFLVADAAPVLWESQVQTAAMPHALAEQLLARIRALDGAKQHFYLFNPALKYPQSDPDGSILGSASVTVHAINANRKALRLAGLPAGYVITLGDYLQIDYGSPSRTALLQAMENATAAGDGISPEFEVRPHLRQGVTTTLSVTLKKPAAKVKLLPGSARVDWVDAFNSRVTLSARQTLAAG